MYINYLNHFICIREINTYKEENFVISYYLSDSNSSRMYSAWA